MNGHTPGPWSIEPPWAERSGGDVAITNRNHMGVHWDVCTVHSTEANARLIAAAPMLLEEFQNTNVQMDMAAECIEAGRYDEALLHVRAMKRKRTAIIAAATGETE